MQADLIEARGYNNRHLQPPDLAATRTQLTQTLNATGPATNHLDAGISHQLETRVAKLQDRAKHLNQALDRASKPKQRRKDRDAPELARRQLATVETELRVARAHLADHTAIVAARPQVVAGRERAVMEIAVIDNVIDRHVDAAVRSPAPYRAKALGERPADPERGARWDRAAESVERYRIGTLGKTPADGPINPRSTSVNHAIGPKPADPAARQRWQQVHTHVAAIHKPTVIPKLAPAIGRSR